VFPPPTQLDSIVTIRDSTSPTRLWDRSLIAKDTIPMLYIYSANTLRAMLADAKKALKLVDDNEAAAIAEMIAAITYELSTRKD